MTTLAVHWEDTLVGHLSPAGGDGMSFVYHRSYLESSTTRPISLALPPRPEPHDGPAVRAWFANLLPEGAIRGQVARALGVSERNELAILARTGGDCAGALRLLPADAAAPSEPSLPMPLPWDELEARLAATPRPSLLAMAARDGRLRLSLAGAQDKLPVRYDGGSLSLPTSDHPSTHLLKVGDPAFPGLVHNELFCLRLARAVGLPAPAAELAPTRTPLLLVERYDRVQAADGTTVRLHQEDFCQASGRLPETKYESEGGPALAEMFAALAAGSGSPLADKRDLLAWVLFNYVTGNADGHAKNASLLYGRLTDTGLPRLAPFYDLVCTAAYGALTRRLAQRIGGEDRPERVEARHWDGLAAAIGVKAAYLKTLGLELSRRIEEQAAALAADGAPAQVTDVIHARCRRLQGELRQ
ncbi:MAG: type II toxin-antitoxin system HipA family toxin [Krumholzibacteria bacterium]|nr:type II toxin-antitoxin system HipA family toxin [Candidatus Krumholzibacteria bacterium]